MTPERLLSAVMARLTALDIDPIAVASARGGSHIHVKVRSETERARLAEVEPGWDLSVAEGVL